MKRVSALLLPIVLCFVTAPADAAGLKITEEYDEFTKENFLRSGNLKLCQPQSAGGMATCAGLRLIWRQSSSNLIAVRIEQPEFSSITDVAFNIDGAIIQYGANSVVTDFDYDASLARFSALLAETSSNVFIVPVHILKAITESKDSGVIRVMGINAVTDYDFYRKTGFGKSVPADKLREFVDRVQQDAAAGPGSR